MHGLDPDIKTARLKTPSGGICVSSGATIEVLQVVEGQVRFRLRFFSGHPAHVLISGLKPVSVRVDKQELRQADASTEQSAVWWWDANSKHLYLTVPMEKSIVNVTILTDAEQKFHVKRIRSVRKEAADSYRCQ